MQIKQDHRLRVYIVSGLLALEVMLSFSSFGYIKEGKFSLSSVPIIIYALGYLFGPYLSVLAGLIFGMTSMWLASIGKGTALDTLYSPILSGNPLSSVCLAIGTRLFLGFMAGVVLQKAKKCKERKRFLLALATIATQMVYTVISFAVADIGFSKIGVHTLNMKTDFSHLLLNLFVECIVSLVVVIALDMLVHMERFQVFWSDCQVGIQKVPLRLAFLPIFSITAFFLIFSIGTATQRVNMGWLVLEKAEHYLREDTAFLLLQIELQQLLSNTALFVIMILVAIIAYSYFAARQEQLAYRAERDMMTGVYNRQTAKDKIQAYLSRHEGGPCTMIMADIDNLKGINDTLGHTAGDEAIKGLANTLNAEFGEYGVVGRLGGDEFMIFLGGVASKEMLTPTLTRLQKSICQVPIAGGTRYLRGSIGVRLNECGNLSLEELYRQADEALYCAKKSGKNTVVYYEEK